MGNNTEFGDTVKDPAASPDEPQCFAFRPLATELLNGTVDGKEYHQVALDAWARDFLRTVDGLLDNDVAAAIAAIDIDTEQAFHPRLIAAKESLIPKLAAGLTRVFTGQAETDRLARARSLFVPCLLRGLANAYSITNIAEINQQVNATVALPGVGQDAEACRPYPLCQYPGLPLLIGQCGVGVELPAHQLSGTGQMIEDALRWRYEVKVAGVLAPQDELCFFIAYNETPTPYKVTDQGAVATGWQTTLFTWLARFEEKLMAIEQWIDRIRQQAAEADTDAASAMSVVDIALIVALVEQVVEAWPDDETGAMQLDGAAAEMTDRPDFSLQLDAADPRSVTLYGAGTTDREPIWPTLTDKSGRMGIGGNAEPQPNYHAMETAKVIWYRRSYRFEAIPDPEGWTLCWCSLSLTEQQSARCALQTVRNANLRAERCTNPEFIYRTQCTTAVNAVIPQVIHERLPKLKKEACLTHHLHQLFTPLTKLLQSDPLTLTIQASFSYPIMHTSMDSTDQRFSLPVVLMHDVCIKQAEDFFQASSSLVSALSDRYAAMESLPEECEIRLRLTLFKSVEGTQLPMLQLTDIRMETGTSLEWWC